VENSGAAPPIAVVGFQADVGAGFECIHHIGARSDRCFLKPFGADAFVVVLGQNNGRQKRHPFEQGRFELDHICGDALPVDLEIADLGPDELHRVSGFGLGGTGQRPDDVIRGQRITVLPGHPFADGHVDLGFVLAEPPVGQQSGVKAEIRVLADKAVEHRQVDGLQHRVDRSRAGGRIPALHRHVIGNGQVAPVLGDHRQARGRKSGGKG